MTSQQGTYLLVEVVEVPDRLEGKLKVGDQIKVVAHRPGENGGDYFINKSRRTNVLYHRNCCSIEAKFVKTVGRANL